MKGSLRALVVEDDVGDVELLLRALRQGGYDPQALRVDTRQAMAVALRDGAWDIVFSDWSMPQFSALEALAAVRVTAVDLPFIIVSGTIDEEVAVEALRAGAQDFLSKGKLVRLVPAVDRELREVAVRRERNKMREQLFVSDRMASVGIVAAGVAHEINNPLAAVMVNLEIALQEVRSVAAKPGAPAPSVDLLSSLLDAQESAQRIRDIVRDVRLFSRIDDDKPATCQVTRVLDSSLRMAWNQIRHRARASKDYAVAIAVEGHESRWGQVFLNLIINAAQAIPEGHADKNEIRISTSLDPDGRVVVEVRDTGSGIPPDVMKKLFTPFFTTKPSGVGTGLGLSICQQIVISLGGEISVSSVLGQGTTFRVHLLAAQSAPRAAESAASVARTPSHRGRILVIDEDAKIGDAIARSLANEHEITLAPLAIEALARFVRGERFDVILCDLMMPAMTGMDLHAELCRIAPDQADKMVFLTGAFTSSARSFLSSVSNARMEKPFNVIELRALVAAVATSAHVQSAVMVKASVVSGDKARGL